MARQLRGHFFRRLYGGFALLIILTGACIGGGMFRLQRGEIIAAEWRALDRSGLALAQAYGDAIAAKRAPSLGRGTVQGLRVSLIAIDGRVLSDSAEGPTDIAEPLGRPELRDAARLGVGHSLRYSQSLGIPMRFAAVPVRRGGLLRGWLRVGRPEAVLATDIARRRVPLLWTSLAAVVTALTLALFFVRWVTSPLGALSAAAEAIRRGETEIRLPYAGDEFGLVAQALNRVTRWLQERIAVISRERSQLLTILGGMVEGLIATDRDERIVHINEAAGALLSVSPKDAIGKHTWEVLRIPELLAAMQQAGTEGRPAAFELRLPQAQAELFIDVQSTALRGASGELSGVVTIRHDVTRLRRLEGLRRDFVANVSHELKTPLTAIRGAVETVLDDPEMPGATQERFLGRVLQQALRLGALVNDLLTLSRIEAQPRRPEDAALIDPAPIAHSLAAELKPAAEARGQRIVLELPAPAIQLRAHEDEFAALLRNLLDNAIKYGAEGGQTCLRVLPGSPTIIEIEDDGPGIPAAHHDRIFERFYTVDKARSRAVGGTGLGLSIVKHLAQALGGQIALKSPPGRGCCFRLSLPASHPRELS